MTYKQIQDNIDALDELLDQEREAVLAGNLNKLSQLIDRKTDLIDELSHLDQMDRKNIGALNAKFGRNQELLRAALTGIQSVSDRLALLRHVRASLDTYDEKGKRKVITSQPGRSVEKRA